VRHQFRASPTQEWQDSSLICERTFLSRLNLTTLRSDVFIEKHVSFRLSSQFRVRLISLQRRNYSRYRQLFLLSARSSEIAIGADELSRAGYAARNRSLLQIGAPYVRHDANPRSTVDKKKSDRDTYGCKVARCTILHFMSNAHVGCEFSLAPTRQSRFLSRDSLVGTL